jgi:hypothetical protein
MVGLLVHTWGTQLEVRTGSRIRTQYLQILWYGIIGCEILHPTTPFRKTRKPLPQKLTSLNQCYWTDDELLNGWCGMEK